MDISKKEASFYLGLVRKAGSPEEMARVICDASGLLDLVGNQVKAAEWLNSRHKAVELEEGMAGQISKEMDRLELTALEELVRIPLPNSLRKLQESWEGQ